MHDGLMTTQHMLMLAATVIGWCFRSSGGAVIVDPIRDIIEPAAALLPSMDSPAQVQLVANGFAHGKPLQASAADRRPAEAFGSSSAAAAARRAAAQVIGI